MKKLLVLSVITSVLFVAGCSSNSSESPRNTEPASTSAASAKPQTSADPNAIAPEKISAKPIEVTWFLSSANTYTGDEEIFKTIQKYTNIKIKPTVVARADYTQKLNTLIASGSLPDLITLTSDNADRYGPQGAFLDLTPYMKAGKLDAYKAMLDKYPPATKLTRSPDGKYYGASRMYDVPARADEVMLGRTDIFAKNNLSTKFESFDDLYKTLVQLKKLYPDSYPYFVRWGASHLLSNQAYYRGSSNTFYLDDTKHKYEYGPESQAYKDTLVYLNKLYSEGLLNPNFATITDDEWNELLATNKGFVTFDYPQVGDEIVQQMGSKIPQGFEFTAMLQPAYNNNRMGTGVISGYFGSYKVISNQSKYKDELVNFLNWMYSPQGINAMQFGIEGESYHKTSNDVVKFLKDFQTPATPNGTIKGSGLNEQNLFSVVNQEAINTYELNGAAMKKSVSFLQENKAFGKATFDAKFSDAKAKKEYNDLKTAIDTYVEEASVNVIIGKQSIDTWDSKVIPQVKKLGSDRALELLNKAYDETFNK
ncbi:extracellular solute-binding protein [Paenibacillus aceris]|uniref:ABC-type glycerol-3-phosphate transport system substrate-binding protein n=1 Tax=Paenibacillus aceris TaxID=869555 RepID=A0ABS4HWK4_9BACL|nr:extracellular solute-binding protein [Paenibacillus aceris]MBP1963049.1 ABC-type glycerol-3-phosphate transport system substrate-binding protein [Paenibacillus aceris]NHW38463.1 extracellular solute-binding protein [Paenibacillus aceris]